MSIVRRRQWNRVSERRVSRLLLNFALGTVAFLSGSKFDV
jgi:hypothetical protein